MKIFNITRVATAAGIAGALAVAAIAYASGHKAAAPAPLNAVITDPATLPKFAHVVVVNATPAQIAAKARSRSSLAMGQRAYVDPETKQLRPAFAEELAAEAAATPSNAVESAAPVVTVLANGTKVAKVDESYMTYAVARIDASGSIKQECVTDKPSAEAALRAAVATGADSHEK